MLIFKGNSFSLLQTNFFYSKEITPQVINLDLFAGLGIKFSSKTLTTLTGMLTDLGRYRSLVLCRYKIK